MKNISRRDAFRVLAGGAVAMAGSAALAQEPVAHVPEETAWVQASSWARENTGIAVAVYMGSDAGVDPVAFEQNFEQGFEGAFGIKTNVFIETTATPGTAVSYYYGEHATEPEPFNTATSMERMQQIVDEYRSVESASNTTIPTTPEPAG